VTRPTLATHVAQRSQLDSAADELFSLVKKGAIEIKIDQSYALADAARAHADLAGRKTTGCTVLKVK
jgi:NADPH2:quinone reductase